MWTYRKGLDTLKSYSVEERDWDIRLDANENPFNLPPLVIERLMARLSRLPFNRYPEIGAAGLKEQIAASINLFRPAADQVSSCWQRVRLWAAAIIRLFFRLLHFRCILFTFIFQTAWQLR